MLLAADDGIHGAELWRSDGTSEGTSLVADLRATTNSSFPQPLAKIGNVYYFVADDGLHGRELWRTDGTQAGTQLVKDILPGSRGEPFYDRGPGWSAGLNELLLFAADDGVNGYQLWRSDGTPDGTELVRVLDGQPVKLTHSGPYVFFEAGDDTGRGKLWKSDGTAAGTMFVKDVDPDRRDGGFNIDQLTDVNGRLYFTASDSAHGRELWTSDGTPEGTRIVVDLQPGPDGSSIGLLSELDGRLLFASDEFGDLSIWSTAGTAETTVRLHSFPDAALVDSARSFARTAGALLFSVELPDRSAELWKTDGTADGTFPLHEFSNGLPIQLTAVGEGVFFMAGEHELWRSDGTAGGTQLVKSFNIEPNNVTRTGPGWLTNVNGTLLFARIDLRGRIEIWRSDGTSP